MLVEDFTEVFQLVTETLVLFSTRHMERSPLLKDNKVNIEYTNVQFHLSFDNTVILKNDEWYQLIKDILCGRETAYLSGKLYSVMQKVLNYQYYVKDDVIHKRTPREISTIFSLPHSKPFDIRDAIESEFKGEGGIQPESLFDKDVFQAATIFDTPVCFASKINKYSSYFTLNYGRVTKVQEGSADFILFACFDIGTGCFTVDGNYEMRIKEKNFSCDGLINNYDFDYLFREQKNYVAWKLEKLLNKAEDFDESTDSASSTQIGSEVAQCRY